MQNNDQKLRIKQAEFLMRLYESETGKRAEDIEALDKWLTAKTKEERQRIGTLMEQYLREQSAD
jgi:hypothetical protein